MPSDRSGSRFYTDRAGEVRVITNLDARNTLHVRALPPGGEWLDLASHGRVFDVLAITEDGTGAYALDDPDGDRVGLYRMALDGSGYERVYEHKRVDITSAVLSTDQRSVYALRVDDGYPSYLILPGAHEEAKVFKVCIMGASFGAYSAVQSAILAPELYACVVANAGIYDLPLLYRRGDIKDLYFGEAYLQEQIGQDEEELRRFSPVYHVEKLRAPVFLAHGRRDGRAPMAHAQRLKQALEEQDRPHVWFLENREAHGFYSNENQVKYLKSATDFLQKHLSSSVRVRSSVADR